MRVFVREQGDFQRILEGNPFLAGRKEDPVHLYVTFLYRMPEEAARIKLKAPEGVGDDEFLMGEQAVFLLCPNGYGRTKLTNAFFERKLKVPATTRNWRTVLALEEMGREI